MATGMEETQKEIDRKAKDLRDLKQKARSGLLDAKRSGELEKLAGEMEALEKQQLLLKEAEAVTQEASALTEAAEAKAKDLSALKAKAKAGLLDAKRSGELEKLAQEVEDLEKKRLAAAEAAADAEKVVAHDIAGIKAKAKANLLGGLRDGQLQVLATEMEALERKASEVDREVKEFEELKDLATNLATAAADGAATEADLETVKAEMAKKQEEIERKAAEFSSIKAKAKANMLGGLKDGQLQKLADEMEAAQQKIVETAKEDVANVEVISVSVRQKAAQGLLAAKRSGELEALAADMEKRLSSNIKEAKSSLEEIKAKAKQNLIAAKRSGELETIAKGMEEEAKILELEKEAFVGQGKHHEAAAKEREIQSLKAKARENLLAAKRSGELEAMASAMHDVEEQTAALKAKAAEFDALKAKARDGLLSSLRSGELQSIATEMEQKQKEIQETAVSLRATKAKFSANLLEAKRSGELDSVVKAMDAAAETATALVESAEKDVEIARSLADTKAKARNNLLTAKRNGELETIAAGMEEATAAAARPSAVRDANPPRKRPSIEMMDVVNFSRDDFRYYAVGALRPKFVKNGALISKPSLLKNMSLGFSGPEEKQFLVGKSAELKEPASIAFMVRNPYFKY